MKINFQGSTHKSFRVNLIKLLMQRAFRFARFEAFRLRIVYLAKWIPQVEFPRVALIAILNSMDMWPITIPRTVISLDSFASWVSEVFRNYR